METFGGTLARLALEVVTLLEGTLSYYVNITGDGGNISSVSLSAVGEAFCLNWSNFLVSFAAAMDEVMSAAVAIGR